MTSPGAAMSPPAATHTPMFIAAGLTAAGYALTMLVFYPGYMTIDASYVYAFMKEWSFGDWQSPLMSIIWWLVDPIAPGAGSMFLLIATLYWLAFGVLALMLARRSVWYGVAVPLIALTPPAFMLLGMIWRDVLFANVWLLAAVITYAAATRSGPARWAVQAIALALVGLGILLRPNAMIAAPLLAAYVIWPMRFDWKRAAVLFIPAFAAGYALVQVVYYGILDVTRENPARSIVVFDLGGITHFTGQNQFPLSWTPEQAALLTSTCYSPERWDVYWTTEPCKFVMQQIEGQGLFGSRDLLQAWTRAIVTHPLAYLRHRATFMWTFLAGANVTLELFHADDPAHTSLAHNPYFKTVIGWHDTLRSSVLFRPGFWLVLAGVVCAFGWRSRATAAGAFAVGVTSSAIVYVLTFFPFGVATDFRYAYWCVLASLAGAVTALLARRERSRPAEAAAPAA